jgi:hypothetical protein
MLKDIWTGRFRNASLVYGLNTIFLRPARLTSLRKLSFSFRANVSLMSEEDHLLARIKGRFSLLRAKYDFEFSDGRVYLRPGVQK